MKLWNKKNKPDTLAAASDTKGTQTPPKPATPDPVQSKAVVKDMKRHFRLPNKKTALIVIVLIVLVLCLIAGGVWLLTRNDSKKQTASIPPPQQGVSVKDVLASLNDPSVDEVSRFNGTKTIALTYVRQKKYKEADEALKPYINNPKYKDELTCDVLMLRYYDEKNTAVIAKNADVCAARIQASVAGSTNKTAQAAAYYDTAKLYKNANDQANATKYYKLCLDYVDKNNLGNDEVVSTFYDEVAKGATGQ